MDAVLHSRLTAALIGLTIAVLLYLAARLALETAKLQQQRREFETREKQKTNAIFVENKVLAFYREVVETIGVEGLKKVRGSVANSLLKKRERTTQIVEEYSRLSDDRANVIYPWERFCFNFGTLIRANRSNNTNAVQEFKRDHLDTYVVETLKTLNPAFDADKEKGIFSSEFKPIAEKELRGATFDATDADGRASA